MQELPKLVFRNVPKSDQLESFINEKIELLDRINPRIVSCRVTLEKPQKKEQGSGLYSLRIEIIFPRREPVLIKKQDKNNGSFAELTGLVNSAFKGVSRQLLKIKDREKRRKRMPDEEIF